MYKLFLLLLSIVQPLCALSLVEQFKHVGYVEIGNQKHESATFDALYACFDEFIQFLQTYPVWANKLLRAKERFIRSKDKNYYATDFFGFYDESDRVARRQISFYYATHFHEFIYAHYPECNQVPEIRRFFEICFEIQKPCGNVVNQVATELGLQEIFSCDYGQPPILFKVVKYLSSYKATRPHYDGTAFSLFLDSTDNQSLLLCSYKSAFTVDDFSCLARNSNSILLIPGTLLTEFSIYPTPHIVASSGTTRYATIVFAMRPNHTQQKNEFSLLPNFNH